MNGEVRNPCEICIIKVNCSSKWDCPRKINYDRYSFQKEAEKHHMHAVKNQAVVDSYFKRIPGRRR